MVKCPGVIGWKANARPPGWKVWENAPLLPGTRFRARLGVSLALLEFPDALFIIGVKIVNRFGFAHVVIMLTTKCE